jgi:hypothetical protein
VNMYSGPVHTAHHIMGIGFAQNSFMGRGLHPKIPYFLFSK